MGRVFDGEIAVADVYRHIRPQSTKPSRRTSSATAGHVLLEIALEQASDETEEDDAAIP
jgi:hypothetical protein